MGSELSASSPYLKSLLLVDPGNEAVLQEDPQQRKLRTFEAVRALLLRATQRQPLVLAVEDLHWMDKTSEELLLYLVDSLPAARLMFVLTYRPGYQNRFGDRTYAHRLVLGPLSNQESVELAEGMLAISGFPSGVKNLIHRKAEGNPFFVEELVKTLLEMDVLRRQERLSGSLGQIKNRKAPMPKAASALRVPPVSKPIGTARAHCIARCYEFSLFWNASGRVISENTVDAAHNLRPYVLIL